MDSQQYALPSTNNLSQDPIKNKASTDICGCDKTRYEYFYRLYSRPELKLILYCKIFEIVNIGYNFFKDINKRVYMVKLKP